MKKIIKSLLTLIDKFDAEEGHDKWVKWCEDENNNTISKLGWLGVISDSVVILKR